MIVPQSLTAQALLDVLAGAYEDGASDGTAGTSEHRHLYEPTNQDDADDRDRRMDLMEYQQGWDDNYVEDDHAKEASFQKEADDWNETFDWFKDTVGEPLWYQIRNQVCSDYLNTPGMWPEGEGFGSSDHNHLIFGGLKAAKAQGLTSPRAIYQFLDDYLEVGTDPEFFFTLSASKTAARKMAAKIASMFPGPGAQIYRNEAGEPLGWDYPSDEPPDPDDFYESDRDMVPDGWWERGADDASDGFTVDPDVPSEWRGSYIDGWEDAAGRSMTPEEEAELNNEYYRGPTRGEPHFSSYAPEEIWNA